jgi:F0F1-type ATP synthase membrane subunit b/b'
MSTGAIIAIIIGALILLALLWFVGSAARNRRLETRRDQAREIRREAEVGRAQADRTGAEAEAQAAEARRQEALARERAATAEEQQREARERHIEAAKKDPDADPDEVAEQFDRGTDPNVERERRFERGEEGDVASGETYQQPRTNS